MHVQLEEGMGLEMTSKLPISGKPDNCPYCHAELVEIWETAEHTFKWDPRANRYRREPFPEVKRTCPNCEGDLLYPTLFHWAFAVEKRIRPSPVDSTWSEILHVLHERVSFWVPCVMWRLGHEYPTRRFVQAYRKATRSLTRIARAHDDNVMLKHAS